MSLEKQPRVPLAFLPTPIQTLLRLTQQMQGPKLLIKRDDHTGLAFGGNKTRKLEYLFGDALQHDIDTVVTAGAVQSNHCRQTAAAAAQLGLRCELLLNGKAPEIAGGNVLLNALLGAKLHWKQESDVHDLEQLAERVRISGHKPYVIPYGGSNAIGTLGYVDAMREFLQQHTPVTHIVLASCSGATHAGLVVGAREFGFSGTILGISVDAQDLFEGQLAQLANRTAERLGWKHVFAPYDFTVNYDYAVGYGVIDELEQSAVRLLASQEGILLDPIYSGRAFGGLLDLLRKGCFSASDTILFWHTGGAPALFAYAEKMQ
jgi:L-cysteate sulfo-lyase